jgi:hypothetical protein
VIVFPPQPCDDRVLFGIHGGEGHVARLRRQRLPSAAGRDERRNVEPRARAEYGFGAVLCDLPAADLPQFRRL